MVTFDPASGIKHYAGSEIAWGYRECSLPRNEIILECVLKLKAAPKADIRERMERYLTRRKRTQPMGRASCGSVFRNPPDASVGKLIEDCGLKGFSVGGAEVSPVHANFIVNNGTASADDVAAVIRHVRGKVREGVPARLPSLNISLPCPPSLLGPFVLPSARSSARSWEDAPLLKRQVVRLRVLQ